MKKPAAINISQITHVTIYENPPHPIYHLDSENGYSSIFNNFEKRVNFEKDALQKEGIKFDEAGRPLGKPKILISFVGNKDIDISFENEAELHSFFNELNLGQHKFSRHL